MSYVPKTPDVLLDAEGLRTVFASHASGVVAIGASTPGHRSLLVASSFMTGISMDPPLALFAVQKNSGTWPALRSAPSIGISIFARNQGQLCREMASRPSEKRVVDEEVRQVSDGCLFVRNSCVCMQGSIYAEHEAGDHQLVLFSVRSAWIDPEAEPLIFHRSRFRILAPDQP